jgi:hypothetical protein
MYFAGYFARFSRAFVARLQLSSAAHYIIRECGATARSAWAAPADLFVAG